MIIQEGDSYVVRDTKTREEISRHPFTTTGRNGDWKEALEKAKESNRNWKENQ